MSEPDWLSRADVELMHEAVLQKDGGAAGLRDEALLESALARRQNLHAYGETDLFQLAASYAEGIAHNHAFVDGNKRSAFGAALLFLAKNGQGLAPSTEYPDRMVDLAQSIIGREEFADLLEANAIETDI